MGFKSKKALRLGPHGFSFVGVRGFEPPTSSSRTTRANRTALHPEKLSILYIELSIYDVRTLINESFFER